MKRVIDNKLYDTETAEQIASYCPVPDRGDLRFLAETLYKTEKGAYFLHGRGGPMTKYAQSTGTGETTGSATIEPLSTERALEWCQNHEIDGETIAEEFDDHIERA